MKKYKYIELIEAKRAELNLSKTAFAKHCGISYSNLKTALSGNDRISIVVLIKIKK